MTDNINIDEILEALNPAQLQAVRHPPQIPLQILAGPGSGKTRVLTMRIAYLITSCCYPPWSICAVTFTNKAANEMRERLMKLIGKENTLQIKMGTFHALCCKFLRKYAKYVGIESNFTVCDADESKKIIAKILKSQTTKLKDANLTLQAATTLSAISKLKAKGFSADDTTAKVAEIKARTAEQHVRMYLSDKDQVEKLLVGARGEVIAAIYKEYEMTLRETNSLDFDDLLVFGVRMFAGHKEASAWCQHVLVDEYQDTNTTQYDLMRHIAQASKCVTIVGDPDQSIYGWRHAEITNLANMQRDFPNTRQIYLEINYRSTSSILAASMAIISQDRNRIQKTLNTSHPKGPLPVLRAFPMEQVEAGFIAAEIKRLVAFTGGMLTWSDFAVLLRLNSHSRVIESALQKEAIPNKVLSGHKFFERMEVKDVLAYLQLVDNPAFLPAFTRSVNVPSRAVGEKTIAEILHRASQLKIPPVTVVERIIKGEIPDIKPPVKRKLSSFVGIIRDLRQYAYEGMSPAKLIISVVELVKYQEHLRKTQPDFESRWENVQELINFAAEVENGMDAKMGQWMADAVERAHDELEEELGDWNQDQVRREAHGIGDGDTPLRHFLQASMLSTDTETPEDEKNKDKVTITTCHAAKGLEWAVVMVPSVEEGVFPAARSEDIDEERRLLYVASTRAQGLLYLSYATSRMVAGVRQPTSASCFVAEMMSDRQTRGLLSEELPALPMQDRQTICTVLGRPFPDEAEVQRKMAEFSKTGRHPVWGPNAPFRDAPGEKHDFVVPVNFSSQQDQAEKQPWGVGEQLGRVPRLVSLPGLRAGRTCMPGQDEFQELPTFIASSVLHRHSIYRPDIDQSTQQATILAQGANRIMCAQDSRENSAGPSVPLTSSSGRVANTINPSAGDIRKWFKQKEVVVDKAGPNLSPKAKGKARAIVSYPVIASTSSKTAPKRLAHGSVARVKTEKAKPVLELEHSRFMLNRQNSPEEPPLDVTQRVGPVKIERSVSRPVKSERSERGRQSLGRASTSARSVSCKGRVATGEPPPPFSSAHSLPPSDTASSSNSSFVEIIDVDALDNVPLVKPIATKRRLGVGHVTGGYANKKFKPLIPMPNGT